MSLPRDVVEVVTTHLFDDIPTLRACSLVDRQWMEAARRWIFNVVVFSFDRNTIDPPRPTLQHNLDTLSNCLNRSPHLAVAIRSLEIRDIRSLERSGALQQSLSVLLPKFNNIRHLTLRWVRWIAVGLELRQSLRHLLTFPSISHIAFTRFVAVGRSVVKELCTLSPSLTKLELSNIRLAASGSDDTHSLQPISQPTKLGTSLHGLVPNRLTLRSLHFSTTDLSESLAWLVDPQICDLSTLTALFITFSFTNDDEESPLLDRILQTCSPSLRYLQLDSCRHPLPLPPNLITLFVDQYSHYYLFQMLEEAEKPTALQHIILMHPHTHREPWMNQLEDLLVGPGFSNLSRITVILPDREENDTCSTERIFQKLRTTGRVRVDVSIF